MHQISRTKFQKIFPGEKPPDHRFWGGRFAAEEGVGREGEGNLGKEKGKECGGARKVVCPGARAGSRRACV